LVPFGSTTTEGQAGGAPSGLPARDRRGASNTESERLSPAEWGFAGLGVAALLADAVAAAVAIREAGGTHPAAAVLIMLSLAMLCLLGLVYVAVTHSRRSRLRADALRNVAAEMGLGDLSARAPVDDDDELGGLGQSLNAMADRIARILQAQKDLLAGVSHELRSPLARIELSLELIQIELERGRADAPAGVDRRRSPGADLLTGIREEVALLERHIQRLMEAQRVGVDRVLVQRSEIVLDELIAQVLRRDEPRLASQGFGLELDLQLGDGVILGDANALDRVLSTLVENALQHGHIRAVVGAPAGPKSLRVETERIEHGAVVRLLDRGPGLTQEQCLRVFEAFFRTDASRNSNTGGTGLGLYLVKRIVEAHGGTARAQPRPGGGLCIELRLPLYGLMAPKETVRMAAVDSHAPELGPPPGGFGG